ncbi:Ras-likeGTP-binding protein YPT1, putative [Entamoeba nuttalli P19]|uniref:Ras-likeGTP-binding protein YPT1, putative n=1 Tax=Entamoeba nuttalli (strain P19) TaxID=1076696 RepID=K2GYL6_ENTNP|nr:Ras-likeGTP-binding protein YPT1, putative [Entamoeba nuttalli P19]EKE40348.1 Ras-likeGTP-binding protein YPT1, putative [Entamoeba nuttalli P19]|eukprot:XP_008857318.1 Ras-likeGTP-binding protein YPT1, putative [Entamoeba nuttalli P19]
MTKEGQTFSSTIPPSIYSQSYVTGKPNERDNWCNENNETKSFTIVIVGDEGVGKMCLINQLLYGYFKDSNKSTNCNTKNYYVDGKEVFLNVWNYNGKQQKSMMSRSYYEGCNAVIVVFDISDRTTYESVKGWLKDVGYYAPKDIIKYLVGNKTDLAANRIVSSQEAQDLAKREGFEFIETSAKSNNNVDVLFQDLIKKLLSEPPRLTNKHVSEEEEETLKTKTSFKQNHYHSCCTVL